MPTEHMEVEEVREINIQISKQSINVTVNGSIPLLAALGALDVAKLQILNKAGARHVGASESEAAGNNTAEPIRAGKSN